MTAISSDRRGRERTRGREREQEEEASMDELTRRLGLLIAMGTVTMGIHQFLLWFGRECGKTDRRWWTKQQVSDREHLALVVTMCFALSMYFVIEGKKTMAELVLMGFVLAAQGYVMVTSMWPPTVTLARKLMKRRR